MSAIAAHVDLVRSIVRLAPHPFLFGDGKPGSPGSLAQLPVNHLMGPNDRCSIGAHPGDAEQIADRAGDLGALLIFGFQRESYWLVLGVSGGGGARSHSAVLLDRVTFL